MITIDCEQGSESWMALRAGVPSASNGDKIITSKGEPSKQARKYMFGLAVETITGKKEETYSSKAMERGIEMESEARQLYEMMNDVDVEEVGFCFMDEDKLFGCSPDGLVGEFGILEIKCPSGPVHIEYLLKGQLPSAYYQQVMLQLLVTGRRWCDFMSYYPGVKPLIVRVTPDHDFLLKMHDELISFCDELQNVVKQIKGE